MSLTRSVAEFISATPRGSIPESVRTLGTRSILDGIGLALAGSVCGERADREGLPPGSRVRGTGEDVRDIRELSARLRVAAVPV
jgi:hypothetical protein